MTILTSLPLSDFSLNLADRDLTEYQITDVVLTACTSGADKGTDKENRLFNHFWSKQENPSFNAVRMRGVNPWLLQ